MLVIGGTGKTGRRVVEKWNERNQKVQVGNESNDPAFDLNNPGILPMTYLPLLRLTKETKKIIAFAWEPATAAIPSMNAGADRAGTPHDERIASSHTHRDDALFFKLVMLLQAFSNVVTRHAGE